jgi:hypothetical protein
MSRTVPPKIEEVISHIAPADAPAWLAGLLCDWLPSLVQDRGVHEVQPSKATMRKSLIKVGEAAASLQQALQSAPIREFLETEGSIQIENLGGLDHTLRHIAERAALAAKSPRISNKAGIAKKGTGKALPTDAFSPEVFCAVIISEVWKYLHGEYPASSNMKAAAAAEAYWRASGPGKRGWGSDPLGKWSYHFRRAKLPVTAKTREEIRRHCIEHSHSFQRLR